MPNVAKAEQHWQERQHGCTRQVDNTFISTLYKTPARHDSIAGGYKHELDATALL